MDKKTIQKKRMMKYFISATQKIIEKESFDLVTIRKVSDLAGFNSATLYNYFKNLDELVYFSSIKYLEDYVHELPSFIKDCENTYEVFINIWRCFCIHSFEKPEIYFHLFFATDNDSNELIKQYFSLFSDEISKQSKYLLPMFLSENLYDRNLSLLKECINEDFLTSSSITELNEMIVLLYESMLYNILNNKVSYSVEEATDKILKYIKNSILSYINDEMPNAFYNL
ncbi:TetR/AcrR family transcriptional regulator [Clostridium oceanicum]|uniref:TetR/AcrR family transcriptional regulator n=1 Tax=Clostridium oceanicum TaxID=1543 RepID=A0ABP3UTN0_9CLOT